MYKTLAVLNGAIVAIMVMINGMLANKTGQYFSIIVIHFVGLLTVVLLLLIKQKSIASMKNIPLFLFSAGAIGIFNVYFNNICFAKLGVTLTLALGLLGQLVTSYIIDHYGLLGMAIYKFRLKKLLALGFISLGIAAMLWI